MVLDLGLATVDYSGVCSWALCGRALGNVGLGLWLHILIMWVMLDLVLAILVVGVVGLTACQYHTYIGMLCMYFYICVPLGPQCNK